MPKASVKRLIECKKEQLIDLVLDIENYPKFIPYCLDAKIYEKKHEGKLILIIADLTIGKGPLKATYKGNFFTYFFGFFGSICAHKGLYGPIWAHMGPYEPIWARPGHLKRGKS